MQHALVVEGGAMRGIFASGVLDAFMSESYYPFDFVIGVSAGASNLVCYQSRQPRRSYRILTELAISDNFLSARRFVRGGHLIDVKWLWEESKRRFPISEQALYSACPFYVTMTDVDSAESHYHRVNPSNIDPLLEATCALPLAYKATPQIDGKRYTDGAVGDSIPVKQAYQMGAKRITVILSHPEGYEQAQTRYPWLMKRLFRQYPSLSRAILKRAESYNQALDFIANPPADCQVEVLAPPVEFDVSRLTMDLDKLNQGYQMGLQVGGVYLSRKTANARANQMSLTG
ncbi:patatin-like phospholipase family protein [Aliagarivorans marinus]|uniref:patatin-like phospholipase family protein n=1 Tax=Aliagarivorans marinus TaxID=561965 RepID=UPI000425E475|nr:patatin family protein [Aliagarivorans marinus]